MKLKKLAWALFIFLAISVGFYPFIYFLTDVLAQYGLLSQKSDVIVNNTVWSFLFKVHITLGGLALLTGWSQFLKKFRNRNLQFHRMLGKVYMIVVLLSGISGLYIGFYASGGWFSQLGFIGLGLAWLITTTMGYTTIRKKKVQAHQNWMIRSYSLTFAAVTLRIWLPLFQFGFGMDFLSAYVIIAWLCWVPNLLWAEWKVRSLVNPKSPLSGVAQVY